MNESRKKYTFEFEFHDSKLFEINVLKQSLEFIFDRAVLLVLDKKNEMVDGEDHMIPARLKVNNPSYKSLPKPGILFDGEVSVGSLDVLTTLPIDFRCGEPCTLVIHEASGKHTVQGSSIELFVDLSALPRHLCT